MRIAVTGSIATDHLMTYPGRFTDHLVADNLRTVSLSFLADDLVVRPGGVAANIAYGLGRMGLRPLLVAAAGLDFGAQRESLESAGVDTSGIRVSTTRHTARFVCTTDSEQNQLATFYPGAMAEAAAIRLPDVLARAGGVDFVLVGPDDPDTMRRHAADCRASGVPFAADPSQQLARMAPEDVVAMIDGAAYLFTNAYERDLLLRSTGLTADEVTRRVGAWVVTRGEEGVRIATEGARPVDLPAVPVHRVVDPTGAGDAFRAGFLAGLAAGADIGAAARGGCALAAIALESEGSQDYPADAATVRRRAAGAYGTLTAAW
jgi:adenosine kinase